MNTRVLMALIVLDLGCMPHNRFTMMVVMALATTVMTGPLLKLLLPRAGHRIPVGIAA